jgi:hypothetical protein
MAKEKLLTLGGLQSYNTNVDAREDAKDAEILKQAKAHAEGLADNYDAAGTAETKVKELADGAVAENTEAIEGLADTKADKTQVATDIENAVKAVNEARTEAIEAVQGEVDALEEAHATDKAALEASIKGITDDYLKAADKTELQGNIDTVNAAVERLTNGVSADEVDGVNDLIQYVKDHGTEVTGMQEGIADNAEAIEAVAGRATTLEGEMDAVEAAVATKVEQEAYNTKVAALEGEDTAMKGRLTALETAIGEGGSVDTQIGNAIADLDANVASTDVEEGKGVKVSVVETDGKLVSVAVEGNYDNAYDTKGAAAKALEDAIAHANGKDEAIADAKKAGTDATAAVSALEEGQVATNANAISALEEKVGEGYEVISEDEISAMFTQA